jgi:hypothetical protein
MSATPAGSIFQSKPQLVFSDPAAKPTATPSAPPAAQLAADIIHHTLSHNPEAYILSIFTNTFNAIGIQCITYKPTEMKSEKNRTQTYKFYVKMENVTRTPGKLWGHYTTRQKIEISNLTLALTALDVLQAAPTRTVFLQNYADSSTKTFNLSKENPTITEFITTAYDAISICFTINVNDANRDIIKQYAEEAAQNTIRDEIQALATQANIIFAQTGDSNNDAPTF